MSSVVPVSSVADAPVRDEQPVWLNTHDEKFLTSGVEQTDSSYRSENISIELSRHEDNSTGRLVVYYVADIYVRSPEYIRTAIPARGYEPVLTMAAKQNAILAINGDFFRKFIFLGGFSANEIAYKIEPFHFFNR